MNCCDVTIFFITIGSTKVKLFFKNQNNNYATAHSANEIS